ncbi:MAG TPA: LytTR family transcriptional regulator DNA-binding domain-containing protein [Prolixibacteraceae bacterium]|nr:LytTR family transcriptional regulator DNA-binding domain-containing protein [Prolixibacteraceae bacterium]HPS13246.1 LytTR family transcriptional regulator DNA-binding domain-containing protein [Prolixibacteraceae bacterium]
MSDIVRTIIIEDELLARNLLKSYLKDNSQIEIIAECENGFDGLKAINEMQPDLVFLDVQMPKLTGFEMLELLDFRPEIIFTTAYNQFAIKAFEQHAIDYLLKPFSKDRLMVAVERAIEKIHGNKGSELPIDKLTELPEDDLIERVVVKDKNKIHIIPSEQIRYVESLDDYVMIYTKDRRFIKQKTMKFFEEHLNPKEFIRIHRSYIVKVEEIAEIQQYEKEAHIVILKNDHTKLKVSKTGYKNLKEVLNF